MPSIEINDIITAGCLEIEWKFIEFEEKMMNIECVAIEMNPYLTISEKKQKVKIIYSTYIATL